MEWLIGLVVVAAVISFVAYQRGGAGSAGGKQYGTVTVELVDALDFGTIEEIEALISKGANVNGTVGFGMDPKSGQRPLHRAIGTDDAPDKVRLLLRHGARVEAKDDEGRTPLIWLAWMNCRPESLPGGTAAVLIANGADVHARFGGLLPIHWAASTGKPDVIEVLLRAGVRQDERAALEDIDLPAGVFTGETSSGRKVMRTQGATPLHFAAMNPRPETVEAAKILIKNRAEVNARTQDGITPLALIRGATERYREKPSNFPTWYGKALEDFEALLTSSARW